MKINFKEELEILKRPVWEKIQKYLPTGEPQEHYKIVRDYPERQGKYFRPGLLLLAAEMFDGKKEDAMLTAAAMQLSEDWLLVHDDFLDHSEERRHKFSLNKIYGDELAVNAGDALHIIMWKLLGDNVKFLGEERGWKVFNKINDILLKTIEGQYMELSWLRRKEIFISESDYYKMISIKAGYYTVTGPLQLGAIIAGALDKDLNNIERWSLPFGYAFQIWDDVMNLAVEAKTQGKEKAGDILEGKRNLMLIHLFRNCTPAEKDEVEKIYLKKRGGKEEGDKNYVLELMNKYGSIDYGKKAAIRFAEIAKDIFDESMSNFPESYAKSALREGISFVINRDS